MTAHSKVEVGVVVRVYVKVAARVLIGDSKVLRLKSHI